MMNKLRLHFVLFVLICLFGTVTLSSSVFAQKSLKDVIADKNATLYPEEDHEDDPFYCFEYNTQMGNIALTLTEEGEILMGIAAFLPRGDVKPQFVFLSGQWINSTTAELDSYPCDENGEITGEATRKVTLEMVGDFSMKMTDQLHQEEFMLDQVLCAGDE